MEGYKLPPVMFTQEEATALLTASKLVQSATDTGITKHYLAALDKIRAILRYSEKEHIEDIDEHIAVLKHSAIVYEPEKELHLQPILKAIGSSLVAEIIYTTLEKSETSTRKIEPVGIYYMGSHWYLVAWCRLRNDYRNFRTDQVKQLRITEETYSKTHPSLQSFLNKMSDEKELIKVVLDVDASIVKRLGQQKYYSGFVKEEHLGNHVRMTFLTSSLMGFSRWLMLFADHAEIIQPVQLKEMVTGIAENILKKTQPLLT